MDRSSRFQMNAPDVINETIDGETVILHLGSGMYYSVGGSGALAWAQLAGSASIDDVATALVSVYDTDEMAAGAALVDFVQYLRDEDLLVPCDATSSAATPVTADGSRQPFEKPFIQKFTDMEDLLRLDPVHEVSAARGWPFAPESQA